MESEEALTDLGAAPVDEKVDPVTEAAAEMPAAPAEKPRRRRLFRKGGPKLTEVPDPNELKAAAAERGIRGELTEAEVAKAFYWLYYLWCKVLGAKVEARHADFTRIGRAWLDLARKIPGAKILIAVLGPVVTMADLFEKLEQAWSVRNRFRERPSWARPKAERPSVVPMPEQGRGAGGE